MFSGLPTLFPTRECRNIEDIFAREDATRRGASLSPTTNPISINNSDNNTTTTTTNSNSLLYEEWVQDEVKYHESSYTVMDELQVSVLTFNVACKRPTPSSFDHLFALVNPVNKKPIDVIVLSFQEVDMSAKALLWKETESMEPWVTGANNAIGADDSLFIRSSSSSSSQKVLSRYCALPPKQLVGMLVCVYLRRPLLPCLKEYLITTVATGTMRTMANKGAIGVRLVLHCTSVCIIAAHLAPGQDNVIKRNEDINTILQSMDFNAIKRSNPNDYTANTENGLLEYRNNITTDNNNNNNMIANFITNNNVPDRFGELLPRDHDIVIVAGDLNYRINLTYEEAIKCIAEKNITALLKQDQLAQELQNAMTPWHGFKDFTPTFMPTYRFDVGTSIYDTSEKHRVPSFTDRILVYTKRKALGALVHFDHITSQTSITLSDHKPVVAIVRLPISVEEPQAKQRVIASLRENVRRIGIDRASTAMTRVDKTQFDFGLLSVYTSCTSVIHTLTITNVGKCVAQVRTLRQNTNDISEAAWLRVSPLRFAILPNESQEVIIEVKLQAVCLPWIAVWHPFQGQGLVSLNSFLLFCVRHGPVHAIECKAVLQPSVFNNSLENIISLKTTPCIEAYEQISKDKTNSDASDDITESNCDDTNMPYIPKELWFMADAIARQPFVPGLFTESGEAAECAVIMKHIDSIAEPLPSHVNPLSVAECLLNFLRNLQSPVVPYNLYPDAIASGHANNAECLTFLKKLPPIHANVWIYIMSLLNYLLRPGHVSFNKLSAPLLARVFSEALIPRAVSVTGAEDAKYDNNVSNNNSGVSNANTGGGGVNQQLRLRLEKERDDASALVEFFLTTPASLLRSYWEKSECLRENQVM